MVHGRTERLVDSPGLTCAPQVKKVDRKTARHRSHLTPTMYSYGNPDPAVRSPAQSRCDHHVREISLADLPTGEFPVGDLRNRFLQ